MHGKEFAINFMRTYFTVVTLINAAIFIMGMQAAPDIRFGYEGFAAPLIYGAAGTLPNILMYSKKELTVRKLLIRKAVQFILIEGLVLFAAFYNSDVFCQQPNIVIGVGISIFVVYVIANMIDWVQNYVSAKQMTEELVKFQESVGE